MAEHLRQQTAKQRSGKTKQDAADPAHRHVARIDKARRPADEEAGDDQAQHEEHR